MVINWMNDRWYTHHGLFILCLLVLVSGFLLAVAFQLLQLHLLGMATLAADAVDVHTVITDLEFLDLLQLSLREQVAVPGLPHLSAAGADQVIVILVPVGPFIFRHAAAELMLHHQSAVQ